VAAEDSPETANQIAPLESSPSDTDAVIDRVIDGDSVDLLIDGSIVEARLIGINAPEFGDCQGPAAAEALETMAGEQSVTIVNYGSDRFDRRLVNLVIGGQSINQMLVETGWALGQHSNDHPDSDAWVTAMIMAAEEGAGMWSMPQACPLSGADVRITDAQANPPGPDDEVLDQEWIEITNLGETSVSLDGWAIRDESTSNRLALPERDLAAGASLRIVTGCGEDSANTIYWCSDYGVWSNQGETALLLAPSGGIEDWALLG
jgi:micrococcal nuclease